MLSLQSLTCSSAKPLLLNPSSSSLRRLFTTVHAYPKSVPAAKSDSDDFHESSSAHLNNFSGVKIEEKVELDSGKLRLDSWIVSRINGISRARVQSSIRSGLVSVNGRIVNKVSHLVRLGDTVNCAIAELQPLRAEPEDIPLDIVYEDEQVIVINKPAHLVVHPAPGNATGTLVNGILHHCRISDACFNPESLPDLDDDSGDEISALSLDQGSGGGIGFGTCEASVRPGIVHRLDKGTSGLLVVAKDEHSHSHLSEQFKKHTINRVYVSLTCGVPAPLSGRVDVPIGRDVNNRIRMIATPGSASRGKTRHAHGKDIKAMDLFRGMQAAGVKPNAVTGPCLLPASGNISALIYGKTAHCFSLIRYKVIEILAGGGCALVQWRLETGRTHQIRAHAKYLGVPLVGDDVYGGTKSMLLSLLESKNPPTYHDQFLEVVALLERPCLHALTLGFKHPKTGENLSFSQIPPTDFADVLDRLRSIGTQEVT